MRKTTKVIAAVGALALAGTAVVSTLAIADSRDDGWRGKWHHKVMRGDRHHAIGAHMGEFRRWHGPRVGGHGFDMLMERFDADKDGKLTQEELDQARTDLLNKHDIDKDGKLSLDEYKALWLEVMQRRVVRSFQHTDVDGDAAVTIDEFKEPFSKAVERMDRNDDGTLNKEDRRRQKMHRDRVPDSDQGDDSPQRG